MGEVILRFCYEEQAVDLVVDDIDKVMWIDVINEYEEFRKKNYVMPEFPSFNYHINGKAITIETDLDLMTMFERNRGINPIYIIVGKLKKMSECVETARQLQCSLKEGNTCNKNVYSGGNVEIMCGGDQTLNFDMEETWEDVQADLAINGRKNKSKRPPKLKPKRQNKRQSISLPLEPNAELVVSQTISYSNAPNFKVNAILLITNNVPYFNKKIPRTTAVRRRVGVDKVVQNQNVILEENQMQIVDPSDMTPIGVGVSSDGSVKNGKKGNGDVDDEVSDNDGDNENLDEVMDMIQDNYDPYADDFWQEDVDNDESYLKRLYKNGEFYEDAEWGKIVLKPWMLFSDKQHFKQVLRDYCIQCRFGIVVEKSSPTRFTATCLNLNCQWRLHSSRLPDGKKWAIKSIRNDEHTCHGLDNKNPLVSVEWAAEKLMDDIRANNDISGNTLNDYLRQRYGVQMAKSSLYNMRSYALKLINGGHDESYSFLPKYVEIVKLTNPNSVAFCAWTEGHGPEKPLIFKSIFISFKGVIDSLSAGCRSLIGVDGAHLKGSFSGVLLSAIAIDANNEIFPFAWAIVSGEDEENWKFFLTHLKNLLEKFADRGDDWCIISDRQKGIEAALTIVWPKVGRRYCCKHLAKNWKGEFNGPLMYSLFWRACSATSPFTFRKAMERIEKENPLARIWLANLGDQSRWTRHKFDPQICSEENKTNFVESCNATLGVDRCRPVLTLLEGLSMLCKAFESGPGEYEVQDGRSMLPVSLSNKTCICGAWQISGIPCKHAIRAIMSARDDPYKYTSTWYYAAVYKLAYGNTINSIPDHEHWPDIDMPCLQPPPLKRGVGRPPRNRRREVDEKQKGKRSTTSRCSNCGEWGHNVRTCKGGLTAKQKQAQKQPTTKQAQKQSTTKQAQNNKRKASTSSSQPNPTIQLSQQGATRKKQRTEPISLSQP
ncbi:Protein FAR1-RELATED SEQUENCE 6, partial [Bienertia sinuspersici]